MPMTDMTFTGGLLLDIIPAAALVWLAVSFIRGRMSVRREKEELLEKIRSWQEADCADGDLKEKP